MRLVHDSRALVKLGLQCHWTLTTLVFGNNIGFGRFSAETLLGAPEGASPASPSPCCCPGVTDSDLISLNNNFVNPFTHFTIKRLRA